MTEISLKFDKVPFVDILAEYLKRNKTSVYLDICSTIHHIFLSIFKENGLDLNINDRYFSFYDKKLSLKEYISQGGLELYYLEYNFSSKESVEILAPINTDYLDINGFIVEKKELKTKYNYKLKIRKISVADKLLKKVMSRINADEVLLPSSLDTWEWRQTFYDKYTGNSYFCSCFKDALSKVEANEGRNPHVNFALMNKSFKDDVCHLCTKTNSDLIYCHPMYASDFKRKYGAYIKKMSLEAGINEYDAENQLRQELGIAKIGEKWVNETLLYNYIKILFPSHIVLREASPIWLEKQRFDIYLPELNLAIEYHGLQHYKPVKHFGGEKTYQEGIMRDKVKVKKCKENNTHLVVFKYTENLNEDFICKKLSKYLAQSQLLSGMNKS